MNLTRIRYFVVVAEEENLHLASARLRVAQPGLTRQIRLLEEELGTILFNRLRRRISLSKAGQSFLEDARQILSLSDLAYRRARAVASGHLDTLRVGFHDAAHSYPILRRVFSSFASEFSSVRFRFLSSSSDQQIEALRTKNLDFGFIYRWGEAAEEISCLSLARDELSLALPRNHRLASEAVITANDLHGEHFVWGDDVVYHAHTDAVIRACATIGLTPSVWHQGLTSGTAMMSLVAAGVGLAILPKQTIIHPDVIPRPIEGMNCPAELLLAWRRDNGAAAVANFVRHARAALYKSEDDDADRVLTK